MLVTLKVMLIATNAGTLTFALYYLVKFPEKMRKLREEIDEVLGDQVMQPSDLGKMPYCVGMCVYLMHFDDC